MIPLQDKTEITALVKVVVKTAESWSLTNAESAALFDVPTATWSRMKAGTYAGTLDQDKVTRASMIIELFKGLHLLFNEPLTSGWPKTPNTGPNFLGHTPIDVIIAGGIPSMMRVRQHLDTLQGDM